ncbi:hypothetical protein [Patulibacter defluvii]|uniref:hypothetical protein n=1 Tax=Patulibacter defluvii TaxID=3095358 RepID=UPI002A75C028|nr:hypothetical protein [Patulibacter sp. DM4]
MRPGWRSGRGATAVRSWPSPLRGKRARHELAVLGPVLALGALLRGALFLAASPALLNNADAVSFLELGAAGSTVGDALHPPGYPLFLHAAFALLGSATAVTVLQHLLGLAAAAMLYAAVRLLGGARWVAAGVALVAACSGDVVVLAHTYVSETPFLFLLAAATLLAALAVRPAVRARPRRLVAVGLGLGAVLAAAVIVRTVGLLLLPVVGLWLLAHRPAPRSAAVLAAAAIGVVAVLGPYLLHRQHVTGSFSFSPTAGWSAYGRVAQIAECSRIAVPADAAGLCESEPGGAARRPDVRAYWFDPERSPALREFGGAPRGDATLNRMAAAVNARQRADAMALRMRDAIRQAWPAFARRRAAQIEGPDGEFPADLRWAYAEQGALRVLAEHGWGGRYHRSDGGVVAAARIQALVRVPPWALLPAALLVLLALFRTRGRRRPIALLGGAAFVLIAGSAAIQLYNPRYAVPAAPLAVAAGLLAAQALGVPQRTRELLRRARRAWGRGQARAALRRAGTTVAAAPPALLVVLAGAAVLRLATTLALRPAIDDRTSAIAALDQGRSGLWSDLIDPPAHALWSRTADLLQLGPLAVVSVEHLIGVLTALLAYLAARRLRAPVWAAVVAAAIVGWDPDRALQEHLAGVSSVATAAALGAFLLAARRPGPGRSLAAGGLLSVALLHVAGTTAVAILAVVAVALLVARLRRRAAPTVALVALPACALGLVAIDRWDVAGGPLRIDASAPFARYVAAVEQVPCPRGLDPDLRPLCAPPGEPRTRNAAAIRVRATAPGDAARQRWLLERWLAQAGRERPLPSALLGSRWWARWIQGRTLQGVDAGRRDAVAGAWRDAVERMREEQDGQRPAPPADPGRTSRPPRPQPARRPLPTTTIAQHAPLHAIAWLQALVRRPGLRVPAIVALVLLSVVAAVRRRLARVLLAAIVVCALAPATMVGLLLATGLLAVAGAAGAGVLAERLAGGARPTGGRIRARRRRGHARGAVLPSN